jgi:hypothetical protein
MIHAEANSETTPRTAIVTVMATGAPPQIIRVRQEGAIWHSFPLQSRAEWVGFWPEDITVYTTILGEVSNNFQFHETMDEARRELSDAIGVEIGVATDEGAQIRAYGGTREEIERIFGINVSTGLAQIFPENREEIATVVINGEERTINRLSGQVRIFVVDHAWGINDDATQRALQIIVNHELAHVLGYWGHSPIEGELMYETATSMTSTRLSDNERRHLRQIYEAFRD